MMIYPALNADTLAVAIAAHHYHDLIDDDENCRIFVDHALVMIDDLDTATRDEKLAAVHETIATDLNDYAHNANHTEYVSFFFADDTDANDQMIFDLFVSDDVIDRVVSILTPKLTTWMSS